MFATASGGVRRNTLSDFSNVMANGKIAMKLKEGDKLICVSTCSEEDDILLSALNGKCIRFPVKNIRVFAGRTSTGVRGIKLVKGDEVIAMSILRHVKVEVGEREAYLQAVNASRRLAGGDYTDRAEDKARDKELATKLDQEQFKAMAHAEEFILTIAVDGQGKRTSAYEYRIAGRGGQGIANIDVSRGKKRTSVAASFTVIDTDQVVMVANSGQIIRCPINKVSIIGRSSRGVTIFNTADGEQVVSASRLRDLNGDDDDIDEGEDEEIEGYSSIKTSSKGNESRDVEEGSLLDDEVEDGKEGGEEDAS
jgi:DNA gyrase subunit A